MLELILLLVGVAILSFVWTLISMKRDGYFGQSPIDIDSNKSSKKGSIIFFKDTVKHVKHVR